MGIVDFSFIQAYAVWNLTIEEEGLIINSRGGEITAEEFMAYVDKNESLMVFSEMQSIFRDHQLRSIPKDFNETYPYFIMCSMEEFISNKVVGLIKIKGR